MENFTIWIATLNSDQFAKSFVKNKSTFKWFHEIFSQTTVSEFWIQWIHKVGCVRITWIFALQRLFPPFELVERSVNLDTTEKTVEIVILDSSNMTVQFHCRIQHEITVFLINDKISSNYRLQIQAIKSQKKCQKFPNFYR